MEKKLLTKQAQDTKGRERHPVALIMAPLGKKSNEANLAKQQSLREKTSGEREQSNLQKGRTL